MSDSLETLYARLREHFAGRLTATHLDRGQITLELGPAALLEVGGTLRDEFGFEQLIDLCGIDYFAFGKADWETEETTSTGFSRGVSKNVYDESINKPTRFAVVYQLLSLKHNRRLRLRCYIDVDPPRLPSVIDIWASANWFEREAFDLFGIMFEGHPDLRRLLTDYGFIGHPFRKDFPLEGNVEVRYDPDKKRVIYQPVTIKNRVLVPKVIRHDNRYLDDDVQDAMKEEIKNAS